VGNVIDKSIAMGGTASFGETSELTGGEHIVRAKAANEKVVKHFDAIFKDYTDMIFKEKTDDLSESQPTKGNIRGGLTTIEEKALGNIEKLGKKTKFVGCLKPAEAPAGKGFYFMDTSSAAAEAVTLWAASGAVVHLFPTGQGNIIGNPIEPVIKISGNPLTCSTMGEHIDHNVSAILRGEMTVDEAGDELIELIVRTANGRLTAAEALGHREFVLTKLYRSA
jgi:(2R)-sulfolactate sulfo-lyase subunit beta